MTIASGEPRIKRKRERTRDGLVAAAEALFALHGPDAVSIDEITIAADVAKGTFYTHFNDKDDLARALAQEVRNELEAQVGRVNAKVGDPGLRMANGLACYVSFAVRQPIRARTLLRLLSCAADPLAPINAGLRADVAAGVTASRFDVPSEAAAVLLAIGACVAAMAHLTQGRSGKAQATARDMITVVLRGFGIKPAEARRLATTAAATAFVDAPKEGKRK